MRKLQLVLLMAALPLEASAPGFHADRWEKFMQHANQFQRKLLGCPAVGWPPEIRCDSTAAVLDNRLWSVLESEGREIFK